LPKEFFEGSLLSLAHQARAVREQSRRLTLIGLLFCLASIPITPRYLNGSLVAVPLAVSVLPATAGYRVLHRRTLALQERVRQEIQSRIALVSSQTRFESALMVSAVLDALAQQGEIDNVMFERFISPSRMEPMPSSTD